MKPRVLSIEVNRVINKLKDLSFGIYKAETIMEDLETLRSCIDFIDNNIFIKETLGKSIRYKGFIESKSNTIEVYDYHKLQQAINKASKNFYID